MMRSSHTHPPLGSVLSWRLLALPAVPHFILFRASIVQMEYVPYGQGCWMRVGALGTLLIRGHQIKKLYRYNVLVAVE